VTTFVAENFPLLAATTVLVASLLLGLLARWILRSRFERLVKATRWRADDVIIHSLPTWVPLWFALGGAFVALTIVVVPVHVESTLHKVITSVAILSAAFWLSDVALRFLERDAGLPGGAATPTAGAVRLVVRVVAIGLGVLMVLNTLGISVTPLLTTLGIGGLAVALGLQETLSNLFAGLQITLAGNIHVGDFVKLESGEDGNVADIQWRATQIRTLSNNLVIIPNAKLAQSVVTNYHRPSRELSVLVEVGVHYASDLDEVEEVTREVARSVQRTVPGAVREFEPFIRFHTFSDSSIDFTVILRATEFTANYLMKHEFIKALARAYADHDIVIPYPIRAINLDQESARTDRSLETGSDEDSAVRARA
jgi:small-conductance mechanosensitive channel